MNLRDYITVYPNTLRAPLCSEVVQQLEAVAWQPHFFVGADGTVHPDSSDPMMTASAIGHTKTITEAFIVAQRKYISDHVAGQWYGGCTKISQSKFHKYAVGARMKKHCDHIHSLFDGNSKGVPVLTIIAGLNDSFSGGSLMFFDDFEVKLSMGDVVVFPSTFLYPHEVTPVTSGTRFSCISWAW